MTEAEKAWEQHFIKLSYSADCNDPIGYFLSDFKASLKGAITNEINKRDSQGPTPDRYDDGFDDGLQKVLELIDIVKPKE